MQSAQYKGSSAMQEVLLSKFKAKARQEEGSERKVSQNSCAF